MFPFRNEDDDPDRVIATILRAEYSFAAPAWNSVSPEAKDLVSLLLVADPVERLTVSEALEHPWFKKQGIASELKTVPLSRISGRRLSRSARDMSTAISAPLSAGVAAICRTLSQNPYERNQRSKGHAFRQVGGAPAASDKYSSILSTLGRFLPLSSLSRNFLSGGKSASDEGWGRSTEMRTNSKGTRKQRLVENASEGGHADGVLISATAVISKPSAK
jgi:serine/threonine protein kinase